MTEHDDGHVDQIVELVHNYISLFNADDFDKAFACYRMPFTWLVGRKAQTVASREEFVTMMTVTKRGLVAEGLGCSRVLDVAVRLMGPYAALVGVKVMRTRVDGSDLAELGGTYLVHSDGTNWRFAAHFQHGVDAMIPARNP